MPIYTFESDDGKSIEKLVPIGTNSIKVDGLTFPRQKAPESFALTGRASGSLSQSEQVRRGYYKLEQEKGSRFLNTSEFTTKQIKKAWGF